MYQNSYTLNQLSGLITTTYILGVVLALIFLGIAVLISNMIAFEGGANPKDPGKRKTWFWLLGILSAIIFFAYNNFYVKMLVQGAPAQDKFMLHIAISTAVTLVVYILAGFLLSKMMARHKIGNWFSSK
ncbi:MAG: hypothetical protein ACOYN6_02500 [Ignavibacteria bacterium]|jgi:uncharacterized membrane protein